MNGIVPSVHCSAVDMTLVGGHVVIMCVQCCPVVVVLFFGCDTSRWHVAFLIYVGMALSNRHSIVLWVWYD